MKNNIHIFYQLCVLMLTVSIGYVLLSHLSIQKIGAETLLSFEAESAVLTGNVSKISDPSRSQSAYIQFGEDVPPQQVMYVSPSGSDSNPGTEALPWKSFFKAAATATAGSQVIFEDGTYIETQTTNIQNSGSESAPIVFMARNKQQAKIVYQMPLNSWKIQNVGKKYITIKDFDITEQTVGNDGNDKFINFFTGADYGRIVGNKIYHTYEDLVKVHDSDFVTVENNTLSDVTNEAIDVVNANQAVIRGNDISNAHREAIFVKGGSRNSQIYNNYIHQESGVLYVAIDLGGSTDAVYAYNPSGYEAYNSVAFDNIIVKKPGAQIAEGLKISGCDNCGLYNNTVVGADHGFVMENGAGKAKGWTWAVIPRNPVFKNNIVIDCATTMADFDPNQGTLTFDYNLVFNCPFPSNIPQPHGVFTNPLLVDKIADWHLQSGSPARGAGATNADHPTFSDAQTPAVPAIPVSFNWDYVSRTTPWDIGAY